MIFSIEINENSKYSKCFNESVYCKSDSDYNLLLLRNICQFENDKLVENGYLFLNDVYEDLGLPKTKEGQLVGWIFDKKNPNGDYNDKDNRKDDKKDERKDRIFKWSIGIAELTLPMIFYAVWMKRGFEFERTGTYTSTTFRGLFNNFKPVKK